MGARYRATRGHAGVDDRRLGRFSRADLLLISTGGEHEGRRAMEPPGVPSTPSFLHGTEPPRIPGRFSGLPADPGAVASRPKGADSSMGL